MEQIKRDADTIRAILCRYSVTVAQQIDGNPLFGSPAQAGSHWNEQARDYFFSSLAMRCASRETFRRAALRCTIFFCAARMIAGSASAMALSACERSPAAIASSSLRMDERKRGRRALLTT